MTGDRDRCLAAGMDGYLAKPIRAEDLARAISACLPADGGTEPRKPDADFLDGARALTSVGGDAQLLRELARLFLAESPTWLADIHDALARRDAPQLQRVAHTLKGSLSTFGALSACEAARRLETMGRSGDLTQADAACAALEELMAGVRPALAALSDDNHES
jgi:HPt (histidine-containing phosphotransfer) domain-containing protein